MAHHLFALTGVWMPGTRPRPRGTARASGRGSGGVINGPSRTISTRARLLIRIHGSRRSAPHEAQAKGFFLLRRNEARHNGKPHRLQRIEAIAAELTAKIMKNATTAGPGAMVRSTRRSPVPRFRQPELTDNAPVETIFGPSANSQSARGDEVMVFAALSAYAAEERALRKATARARKNLACSRTS